METTVSRPSCFAVWLGLALALIAGGGQARQATAEPNLYELHDHSGALAITYSTSSFAGVPLLTYVNGASTLNFQGDEIRVQDTEIGRLVTVTIAFQPDINFQTLTLLLPHVRLAHEPQPIANRAIVTTHQTPFIAGPFIGQQEIYRKVIPLKGTAQRVVF